MHTLRGRAWCVVVLNILCCAVTVMAVKYWQQSFAVKFSFCVLFSLEVPVSMLLIGDKGGGDGEGACCRDVSDYSLHTMTTVSTDQVVCDEKCPAGSTN